MRRLSLLAACLTVLLGAPVVTAAPAPAAPACRPGANGGATAPGVTADRIRLLVPRTAGLLDALILVHRPPHDVGIEAAVRRVNEAGGICGRQIQIFALDDGGDPAKLADLTRDTFAIAVAPASAAVPAAVADGTLRRLRVPVVGRASMAAVDYRDPYVWPVAAPTVAQMRAMARDAYQRGARTFALVHEDRYPGGAEGAAAFADYVRTLRGARLHATARVPSTGGDGEFLSAGQSFRTACGSGGCDAVVMMLTAANATKWINSQPDRSAVFGRKLTAATQPLLDPRFARDCGSSCDGLLVWTGYHAPYGSADAAVRQYAADVRAVDPAVDPGDPTVQGAYAGTALLVEALRRAGPSLTRESLQAALARGPYRLGVTEPVHFSGRHRCGNLAVRPYRVESGTFTIAGRPVRDPLPCVFPR